ncbi:MAG: protein kinase [Myxococcales bacterium]|nr:protein kinase [Myxococcales bacterium]
MAEVYAAKLYGADGFEKDLVIKQILPQHARDPEFVQSFIAEAKIAVGLTHANIVAIYELGRVDGTYFIAMELVDGLDAFALLEAARRHQIPVPVGTAVRVVEEVAHGLDYAHRRRGPDGAPLGLVHRDLNPRNVLVSRDGDVKILDFGIAKTAPGVADMPKTRAGVVKGTTGYMSPEQAAGREIDARTDIYQAGLLLFELLTGTPVFWTPDESETRNRMRAHAITAPSVLRPEIPPQVDKVVLSALARDKDRRYQTAAAFAEGLTLARAGLPDSDAVALGHLVNQLRALDALAIEAQSADDLPATQDFSHAISQAIEQSIVGKIETFARGPGLPEPGAKPVTGSTPLDVRDGSGPQVVLTHGGSLRPSGDLPAPHQAVTRPTPTMTAGPTPPRRRGLVWGLAALGAAAIAAALGVPAFRARMASQPAEDPQPPVPEVVATTATVVLPPPVTQPRPADPIPTPVKGGEPLLARSHQRLEPRPESAISSPLAFAPVAFGTRSCSSRVTVDGRIVTRTTPSYGHRLSAGRHTVLIEGTSCPPIERPGSLRRVLPAVLGEIDVEAGASLRIIADFDEGRLIVRRVE